MTRNIFIFLGTFVAGALIALVTRTAKFQPHAGHEGHPAGGGEYSGMVSNSVAPSTMAPKSAEPATNSTAAAEPETANAHAGHGAAAHQAAVKPVNTVCAICGMRVDPNVPTLEYQGRTIGFGCKMCAPKFKADPDRYGPVYLRNEVMKK